MVFNWFRRQFSDRSEPAEEETTPAPPETEETEAEDKESDAEPASESTSGAEDYLSWAKAAYQNIQKQKQTASVTETPEDAETEPEPEPVGATETTTPTEAEPETVEEPEATAPATPETGEAAEPETVEAPEATETEAVEEPEATASIPPETEEAAPEPTESLPFWARAEAERQERMERLKATAIETPPPEAETPAQTEPEPAADTEAVEFDENFIWSAEVLAAQGRRPEDISAEEITWLKRLRQGLGKTRRNLVNQLKAIVGQGPLNEDAVMEIEALLLQADVGVEATDRVIDALQARMREETLPPEAAIAYLKQILRDMLDRPYQNGYKPSFVPEKDQLNVWLMAGVNGSGKTTTIGKIAHLAQKSDYRCLIAAADTFRAAAVEQVKIWGQRSNTDVIANPGKNTDPAAVVFDGISAAQARGTELLLVDTAGRLQNKKNLMDELSKIRRIIDKKAPDAVVESLLVLDATLGQNGLRQAQVFAEAAKLSGVVLTKLDGTARGGVALAVVEQMGLPIRFIGAGEGIEDLRPFSSYEFVEALLRG
jgi:fused signal recognition particle receptor